MIVKTLVIAVDVDDDLGQKANISGPVIGEDANIDAANKLAMSDPEDPDANVIFKAVNIYRKLKREGKDVEVVTLTGHKNLGVKATSNIADQLEMVLKEHMADSAILVGDGSSDESVLPIISSRLKIIGNEIVFIKQAKELEKTYFVLLEKLKDPHYAKVILGIPGLIIVLASIMYLFNISWQFIGFLFGSYLIVKGFGLWDAVMDVLGVFRVSKNNAMNFLFYLILIVLFGIGIASSYQAYVRGVNTLGLHELYLYAYVFNPLVDVISFAFFLAFSAKIIDHYSKGSSIKVLQLLTYLIIIISIYVITKATIQWILNISPPYISFGAYLGILLAVSIISYVIVKYISMIRKDMIFSMDLKNFDVFNKEQSYLGRVYAVDRVRGVLRISTSFGKKIAVPINSIDDIEGRRITVNI